MSKPSKPDTQPTGSSMYRVQYEGCPQVCMEAASEADAADKYRDRYDLHFTRKPKVERWHGGNR